MQIVGDIKMKKKRVIYIIASIAVLILTIIVIILVRKDDFETEDYTWYSDIGSKGEDIIIRGKRIDEIKGDINKLIFAINKSENDPETFRTPKDKEAKDPPKLKLINVEGHTVNVEVINAEYLTQRMGTTGAEHFLAVATFTLTEYNNIKYVNFKFEEGDHAIPGLYSRESFLKTWKIKP
jgi:hypothetical protein